MLRNTMTSADFLSLLHVADKTSPGKSFFLHSITAVSTSLCSYYLWGVTMVCLLTLHNDASYTISVRQYRILPCRFLQCIPHGKPPCVVLILPISFRAYKGLAPSGKKTPAQSFVLTKNSCIFGFFSVALQQVRSAHAGHTHHLYASRGFVLRRTGK